MSIKKRRQIRLKAENKRKKRRDKIKAAGKNPDQYFVSGIYVG
ncbi:MAG: hypothetical protein V1933_01665 [Candidatus Omnitrophota bacterium]